MTDIAILRPSGLRLVEVPLPVLDPEDQRRLDAVWDDAVRGNPHLFDGPVAACVAMDVEPDGAVVLRWARATYRRYIGRRDPSLPVLPGLFASVLLVVSDGTTLVGRMAATTSTPGVWGLPGGHVEPPPPGRSLTPEHLRDTAAREFTEETGLEVDPESLAALLVLQRPNGTVGVVYNHPGAVGVVVRARFRALQRSAARDGAHPELDALGFVKGAAGLATLDGPVVDFLEPVLRATAPRRFTGGRA